MTFTWKDLIYIGLIVTTIIITYRLSSGGNNKIVDTPKLLPVVNKVDKKGTSFTQIKGIQYSEQDLKRITDSLRKVLGSGKIIQVTNTVTIIDTVYSNVPISVDTTTGNITSIDSNKDVKISFSGNYHSHTGKFSLQITPDTASYITSLKHHWFKPDELSAEVYHSNKLFIPVSGNVYNAKIPRTIAVIGPFVGIGYGTQLTPVVGIGVTFNLIPIRLK